MAEWLELLTRNLEVQGSGLLSDHWLGLFARVVVQSNPHLCFVKCEPTGQPPTSWGF